MNRFLEVLDKLQHGNRKARESLHAYEMAMEMVEINL